MGRRKAVSKPEGEDPGSKRMRTSDRIKEMVKDTAEQSSGGGEATISKPEPTSGGGGVDPLTIDHILEIVFQHIIPNPKPAPISISQAQTDLSSAVVKNVLNLRLVCKQWKEIATRLYRRNRTRQIIFGNPRCQGGPYPKSENERMRTFVDLMKSSDQIPVRRYKMYPDIFVKENEQGLKEFMSICGSDAVSLTLCCNNSSTMQFTRRTFPDLDLTRLKALTFHFSNCCQDKKYTCQIYEISYLVEVFLSAAKALNTFGFTFTTCDPRGKWSQVMIKRFGESISNLLPKTVQLLILDLPLSDSHLNSLIEKELKLEAYVFNDQREEGSSMIRTFLEKQVSSLMVLKVKNPISFLPLDFPRFEKLLNLSLEGGTIQYLSYPDTFPELTTLDLSEWRIESTCVEFLNRTTSAVTLKKLYLPYRFPQAQLVKRAAQCFPNITKLYISQSLDISDALQEVFVYFENIEELYITFPGTVINADSIFIGIPENLQNVDMMVAQRQPSILNLTKLKKLVISDCGGGEVRLTDYTAYYLLHMTSLKEVHTKKYRMTTQYMDLLREKVTLKVTGGGGNGA